MVGSIRNLSATEQTGIRNFGWGAIETAQKTNHDPDATWRNGDQPMVQKHIWCELWHCQSRSYWTDRDGPGREGRKGPIHTICAQSGGSIRCMNLPIIFRWFRKIFRLIHLMSFESLAEKGEAHVYSSSGSSGFLRLNDAGFAKKMEKGWSTHNVLSCGPNH